MKYRAEIDGLRAFAVVPVLLFHAGFAPFNGGYVGVDVFFVISGFLITSIILKDLDRGNFSLIEFYERRIRRIIPALFFVILVCVPFAWHFLTPADMREFAKSVKVVVTFSSNFFFWKESGYFDTAAELKPLLHTWSLAVEEQYYILFPILLMFGWRFGKRAIFIALAITFTTSLTVAHWGAYNLPTASFFLLPTRGWEILLGALCAFYLRQRSGNGSGLVNQLLSLLGLSLMCIAVFTFDENTPAPGLHMLVPTVGAALIILFARQGTLAKTLLGSAPFVQIGLISYSLYLWHQPVFAFARRSSYREHLDPYGYALLIGLSFLLAWVSWKFVETPFRQKTIINRKRLFTAAASMFAVLICFGQAGDSSRGFKSLMYQYKYDDRTTERIHLILETTDYDAYENMYDDNHCMMWVENTETISENRVADCYSEFGGALVVLGDSHAMNLYNIIAKSGVYPFVIGVSRGGCRAHNSRAKCPYGSFDAFLTDQPETIGGIIYHQSGSYFVEDTKGKVDSQAAFEGDFRGFRIVDIGKIVQYLQRIESLTNANIMWIGPFLEYRFDPVERYAILEKEDINPNSVRIFRDLEVAMASVHEKLDFKAYRKFEDFIDMPMTSKIENCFIFRDKDHFSRCGEDILSKSRGLRAFDWQKFVSHLNNE